MLNIAIIEDEPKMAEALKRLLIKIEPDCKIAGIADSIEKGTDLLAFEQPDIAFFDVELKDGLSFEILYRLPEINFQLIFVTAHSSYAVQAFEFCAVDYIVKPVVIENVSRALEKAKSNLKNQQTTKQIRQLLENLNTEKKQQKIILQTTESAYFVKLNDIVRCESDNNYCIFILANGEKIMVSKTLKDYENLLPKEIFFRSHQSHLININYIHKIKKRTFKIILSNGEQTPLAVRRKDEILELMKRNL